MATSKTLTPTNVTISIPAMTDAPDASVFSNCVDKTADAVNKIYNNIADGGEQAATISVPSSTFVTLASISNLTGTYILVVNAAFAEATAGIRILLADTTETNANNAVNSVLATGRACLQKVRILTLTSSDVLYIRAYQTSGSTINVAFSYRLLKIKG